MAGTVFVVQDTYDDDFPVAVLPTLDAAWEWIKSQRVWEAKEDPSCANANGMSDDHYAVCEVASYL